MKTIELKAGQQIAQFTTKSVTFDGKEFFYSRMSNLTHDPATQKYYFTYDGESKILPYEAKDAQILTAIFSQVLKLQAAKAAKPQAPAPQKASADPSAKASTQAPAAGQATAAEQAPAEEPIVFTDKKAAKQAEKERKKQRKLRNVQKKND